MTINTQAPIAGQQATYVQRTKDYSQFKYMIGNRPINEGNVKSVIAQLSRWPQVAPIVVNEHFEVIDGQHRLQACQRLGVPVEYIVRHGFTIDHVISANASGKLWSRFDYVEKYASQGLKTYKDLVLWIEENKRSGIPKNMLIYLAQNDMSNREFYLYDDGKMREHSSGVKAKRLYRIGDQLQMGKWVPGDYSFARKMVAALQSFTNSEFRFCTQKTFVAALMSAMRITGFDVDRLHKQANKFPRDFVKCGGTSEYLHMFEVVYNKRQSDKLPILNNPERKKARKE